MFLLSIVNYLEKLPETVEFPVQVQVAEQSFETGGSVVSGNRFVLRGVVRVGIAPSAEDALFLLGKKGEEFLNGGLLRVSVHIADLRRMQVPVRPVRLGDEFLPDEELIDTVAEEGEVQGGSAGSGRSRCSKIGP